MTIGFIGGGNMAGAIIKGLLTAGIYRPGEIFVTDITPERSQECAGRLGVTAADTAQELIDCSDTVVLAVKPGVFPSLLPEIAPLLQRRNPLVLSIAAGKTLGYIEEQLGFAPALVRVMPNINAKVGAAMSAFCANANVTQEQKKLVSRLLRAAGQVQELDEGFFPLFGVIAGSGPAFAYLFIDALARAAVKNGMNKQVALEIAAQTVLGSAKLILESGEHPWSLIDQVCSPGGTTIEGIAALQENGLETAVRKAVDAALEKDQKL